MNYLPVTLACASVITVFGASPLIGNGFRRRSAAVKTATPEKDEGLIFDRALILMDLSACASETVELIARIPGVGEAILLDVMDAAGSSGAAWITGRSVLSPGDRAKMRLVAHKNYLESLGTPARSLVELTDDHDISGTFLRVASREDASLLVMRSEPMSRLRSVFRENSTTGVLRRCTMHDMLIYPARMAEKTGDSFEVPPARDLFTKILCPTDLSSISHETFAWAAQRETVSEIVLMHVIPPPGAAEKRLSHHEVEQRLHAIKNRIDRKDLKVTSIVREGDPAHEISRVAEEQKVSLILMPRCGLAQYVSGGELGKTVAAVANHLNHPLLVLRSRVRLHAETRELAADEFNLAEELWVHYHDQKADRVNDRIFAVHLDDILVSLAWCKRHPDGLEVDGVFTLEEFRRHHYARRAVETLIAACGSEALYMHATLELVEFYKTLGFVPIPEDELPPTIKARFDFALGNLEGTNACPMRRLPPQEDPFPSVLKN
jgi:nucleotide-binding universal stress UspA family protein/N-acetylglutamate synthase-like GNAT family acetyltransferase